MFLFSRSANKDIAGMGISLMAQNQRGRNITRKKNSIIVFFSYQTQSRPAQGDPNLSKLLVYNIVGLSGSAT